MRKDKTLIRLIAILALWLLGFQAWSRWITAVPLDEPISLVRGSTVAREIPIPVTDRYFLELMFERAEVPFKGLRRLVGDAGLDKEGKPSSPGVRVPVKWSLVPIGKQDAISGGEVDSFGLHSSSETHVGRTIDRVHLPSGRYIFHAEVSKDVPELSHLNTRIALRLHPKLSSSRQFALVFFGSMFNYFLVAPAAVVLSAVLAFRLVRRRRAGLR